MGFRVAKGRRVKHNQQWLLEGDVVPLTSEEAEPLLVDGAIVEDKTAVSAPTAQSTAAATDTTSESGAPEIVSLNNGTDAQLRTLPGVGPGIAKKLRDARPFETLDAAKEASGLSDEQWSQLEPLITL